MRWVGHEHAWKRWKVQNKILIGKPGRPGVDGRIILKRIFKK
jgi:hypothetical protein